MVRFPVKGSIFLYSKAHRPALEPTLSNGQRLLYGDPSASYPIGIGYYLHGGEKAAAQSYHTSPSKAEVKNVWSYASSPHRHILAYTIITSSLLLFTVHK
jgi:hypothetical protein